MCGESIGVLGGGDGIDHGSGVEMLWKGELDDDSVCCWVGIEVLNTGDQVGLGDFGIKLMYDKLSSKCFECLLFFADVDL